MIKKGLFSISLDWLALHLKFGSVYIYQMGQISRHYQGPHGSLKSLKVFKNMKSMKSL